MNRLFDIFQAALEKRPSKLFQRSYGLGGVGVGESLEPGAEPETTFQATDCQFSVNGSVSSQGDNIILTRQNGYDVELLECVIQPQLSCVAFLKAGGVQLSASWTLAAGEKWSAPCRIIERSFDLILNLSIATPTVFDIRWKPCYGR